LSQYFAPGSVWKQDMLSKAEGFDFMITETEHEALMLEDNLIKKHQPIYNRLLKADNSYVYIKITK
jgi:excinuclease ABC subunit C